MLTGMQSPGAYPDVIHQHGAILSVYAPSSLIGLMDGENFTKKTIWNM